MMAGIIKYMTFYIKLYNLHTYSFADKINRCSSISKKQFFVSSYS